MLAWFKNWIRGDDLIAPIGKYEKFQDLEDDVFSWFHKTEFEKNKEKWDHRFLKLAEHISQWSKDPSTKIGSVIVDEQKRVVSVGYNGFPQGIEDTVERLNNRELKYSMVCHGEMNAILFASSYLADCTLYVTPFMPCSRCAAMIIQTGIKRVVAPFNDNPRWVESFKITEELFKEAGVELNLYQPDIVDLVKCD